MLALLTGACMMIPHQDLGSLLASEGVQAPWYVEQTWLRDGWLVETWDPLKQVGPQICLSYQRYYAVDQTEAGYKIEARPDSTLQKVALADCARVSRPKDFAGVYVLDTGGPLSEDRLRNVVETALGLSGTRNSYLPAGVRFKSDVLANDLRVIQGQNLYTIEAKEPDDITASFAFDKSSCGRS